MCLRRLGLWLVGRRTPKGEAVGLRLRAVRPSPSALDDGGSWQWGIAAMCVLRLLMGFRASESLEQPPMQPPELRRGSSAVEQVGS